MPTPEENYLLLWSIIVQKMNAAGQLDGVDWSTVAQNLGIEKAGTASVRFCRLKDDFSKLGFPNLPDKSGGQGTVGKAGKSPKSPKIAKTKKANPKARAAGEKTTPTKAAGKKGKATLKEDDADIENDGEGGMDEDRLKQEAGEDVEVEVEVE